MQIYYVAKCMFYMDKSYEILVKMLIKRDHKTEAKSKWIELADLSGNCGNTSNY